MALKQYADSPVEFEGAVLADREENYYDDSDYYAIVWDEEAGRLRKVYFDTTRCYQMGTAKVDATPEVIEKAKSWLYKWALVRIFGDKELEASRPQVGRVVVVTDSGPKKHRGKIGKVFWKGMTNPPWAPWEKDERIGFETAEGEKVFVSSWQAEVSEPEPVDIDDVRYDAWRVATSQAFYLPFTAHGMLVV